MPLCGLEHQLFENRTLFLFKQENMGKFMICLCCKSYVCCSETVRKQCSKGVSLGPNPLPHEQYEKISKTNQSLSIANRGFWVQNHQVFTN